MVSLRVRVNSHYSKPTKSVTEKWWPQNVFKMYQTWSMLYADILHSDVGNWVRKSVRCVKNVGKSIFRKKHWAYSHLCKPANILQVYNLQKENMTSYIQRKFEMLVLIFSSRLEGVFVTFRVADDKLWTNRELWKTPCVLSDHFYWCFRSHWKFLCISLLTQPSAGISFVSSCFVAFWTILDLIFWFQSSPTSIDNKVRTSPTIW